MNSMFVFKTYFNGGIPIIQRRIYKLKTSFKYAFPSVKIAFLKEVEIR